MDVTRLVVKASNLLRKIPFYYFAFIVILDQKAKVQTNEIKSNLSPFAAEFVPRFAMTFTQPPPVATNGAWNDYCCQSEPTLQASDHPESEDFVALSELREFIDRISVKPNRYESLLPGLTDVMNNWIAEEEIVIESVVNLIVDQVNARYF